MSTTMNIYVPEDTKNIYISPYSSTTNEFKSLSEEFICQLSDSQTNLISANASKYKSHIDSQNGPT